jgi:hypothetical protein
MPQILQCHHLRDQPLMPARGTKGSESRPDSVTSRRDRTAKHVAKSCVCNRHRPPANVKNPVGLDPVTTPRSTRRGHSKYAPGAHLRQADPDTAQ